MKKLRLQLCLLCLIGTVCFTSGCGARFITAKTLLVDEATCLDPANDPIGLVRDDENLPIDQQIKADELRDMSTEFYAEREKDLSVYGDLDGLFTIFMHVVSQNTSSATFPQPTEFAIYTSTPHSAGQRTQSGYAEIRFGGGGQVYTTNRPSDTFFEIEISDIYEEDGDWIASGSFSMIARNMNDNSDTDRLFVMDGAFVTKIKNH